VGETVASLSAVMVTRTGKSGRELTQRLQQKGFAAWFNPTLKIIGEELLLPIEDFQQVIFVSANAVKYSVGKSKMLAEILPNKLIAVGPGTAKSLQQAGFDKVIIPAHYNSEGLLNLPQLQSVTGQHLLIVKGRGGRTLLAEKLTARGAICHNLEVYCRITAELDWTSWQDYLDHVCESRQQPVNEKIICIASVDALQALHVNLGENFNYNQLTLVVASQRIAEYAKKHGHQQIVVAKSAANDDMLTAVEQMVCK